MRLKIKKIDFVALDGHRIAKRTLSIEEDLNKKVIIPPRALNEISKMVQEGETVNVLIVKEAVFFFCKYCFFNESY